MADPTVDDKLDNFMTISDDGESASQQGDMPDQMEEDEPLYRITGDDKIPVSKAMGKIWKSRKQAAAASIKDSGDLDRWNTAINYFRNDHQDRRDTSDIATDKESGTRLTTKGKESENLVFANTTSLVPAVYAKNPRCEISCEGRPDLQDFCDILEKIVNILLGKRVAPGVGLKPKARKAVILATLTNYAYIETGYVRREDSSENAVAELQKLAQQLEKAKNKKEIREIEAKLEAIEKRVDLLNPSGPFVRTRKPHDVLKDPDAESLDECRWIMISDYLDSTFLQVVYGKQNDEGKYESIFKPNYILKVGDNSGSSTADEDLTTFQMFNPDGAKAAKDYGFDDDEAFKRAQRTRCWYVWDKATRRVYLFNDSDWTWPIWVWNDPYNFDDFFPIEELEFYTDPVEYHGRGEVMYYIDMQDAIDKINNEVAKTREYISGKVVYNRRVLGDQSGDIVDAFLAGTTRKRALGIDVPPETDISKVFSAFLPTSAHALNTVIFDKQRLIEAIDRVSSVTNVMRGVEYKTNTTNKAIESYESNTQTRLDEKIDAIEDFIGGVAWKIAQLCVQFMPDEQVEQLVGSDLCGKWKEMKPQVAEMKSFFTVTVVGGSALKPTSANKKQQAAQLGQILGQFARATPAALIVALKVMEKAYDEVLITKPDWELIMQGIQASMQQQSGQQQNDSNDRAGEGGGKPQQGGQQQPQADPQQMLAMALDKLSEIVDSMPLEAKIMLANAIKADVPVKQAVAAAIQESQGQQPGQVGA